MRKEVAGLLICSLVLLSGCSTAVAPEPIPQYDAKTFYDTLSITGASFSSDESSILVSTDATGVFNAYRQPAAGGEPQMLTNSTSDATFGISWFPEDDRFLFTADQGGNELNHLFVQQLDGTSRDLTPGDGLKAFFAGWNRDRKSFWVSTNERDPRFFDLYRYATEDFSRQLIFENSAGFSPGDISQDGRWIALNKTRNNADSDIFIWDATQPSQDPKKITEHEGDVNHRSLTFTPDSSQLYYLTDGHGEYAQAWAYDLESGEHSPVVVAEWDVQYIFFSENGAYRVTGINEDAQTVVTVLNTATGEEVEIPGLPEGDIGGVSISRSESKMAIYLSSDVAPRDLYVVDLRDSSFRRLSNSLNPAISADHLVEAEVIRYPSFDGLEIPALLYRPKQATEGSRAPGLIWVHGGPGGQSRKGYSATIQHLVNHGYAVLAVNNRGSSGYGKTFHHLDDRKHGEVDLQDCVWGRKYLEKQSWIDSSKIGIIGGSYGGYMVAAALAFEPEAFEVGVDIFGVTNWLRTLKSIPPWWAAQKEALYAEMGDPDTDEERLRRISPLFHASNITRPLLVIQGANDPRVLQVESDEIVEKVRQKGVPVEYVLFPDEGHGFRKKENRIRASQKYVEFLDQYLKGAIE